MVNSNFGSLTNHLKYMFMISETYMGDFNLLILLAPALPILPFTLQMMATLYEESLIKLV